jgi:hypothetical protein
MRWLLEVKKQPLCEETCWNACNDDNIDCLKIAVGAGCELDIECLEVATGNDNLEMVKYIIDKGAIGLVYNVLYTAGSYGNTELFDFFIENHGSENRNLVLWHIMRGAVEKGRVEAIRHLVHKGCPLDGMLCYHAAHYVQHESMRLLLEQGCPWDMPSLLTSIDGCDDEMIKMLLCQRIPENVDPIIDAAFKQSEWQRILTCLIGCGVNMERAYLLACSDNRVDILAFLKKSNIPMDIEACMEAGGADEVRTWLLENNQV